MTDQIESASSDAAPANPALSDADTGRALFEPALPSPNVPVTETGKSETDRKAVEDDAWLDDWDLVVHRCSDCQRPFGTAIRLTQHRAAWHSVDSPKLPPYERRHVWSTITSVEKQNLCVLVDDGDLFVKIPRTCTHSTKVFQINSQILWAVSPVFRAMLGPKSLFKEALEVRRAVIRGSNSPTPIVTLDDPIATVQLVLQILCHRHEHPSPLPETLSVRDLSEVAAFADKYELHDVLRPWALKWRWSKLARLPYEDAGHKVFVSWVFGMEDEFAAASSAASISMFWSLERGLSLDDKGLPIEGLPAILRKVYAPFPKEMPKRIIEGLVDLRKRRIDLICDYILLTQASRLEGSKVFCKGGLGHRGAVDSTYCDDLQFGHFMKSMTRAGLLSYKVRNFSPLEISERIQRLKGLPGMPCTWVTDMRANSLLAVEMDLCLKLSDFAR